MENCNILQKTEKKTVTFRPGEIFLDTAAFEAAQRMVAPLVKSDLVPLTFQGKVGNCLIALEMAQRVNASPLMVMQNLYIVHGKPAWSSQFLIACINASGKFTPLRYKMTGKKGQDSFGCIAWATDNAGEVLESPEITIGMAKAEGWYTKNGSKWQTMPELMLRYRCATLFARLFAPELTMGIQTDDEVVDIAPVVTEARSSRFEVAEDAAAIPVRDEVAEIENALQAAGIPLSAAEVKEYVEGKGEIFAADLIIPALNKIADAILGGAEQ